MSRFHKDFHRLFRYKWSIYDVAMRPENLKLNQLKIYFMSAFYSWYLFHKYVKNSFSTTHSMIWQFQTKAWRRWFQMLVLENVGILWTAFQREETWKRNSESRQYIWYDALSSSTETYKKSFKLLQKEKADDLEKLPRSKVHLRLFWVSSCLQKPEEPSQAYVVNKKPRKHKRCPRRKTTTA
jgi:hypothetical protein